MAGQVTGEVAGTMIIDSDAHVMETEHTWDFLDPGDEEYRPILLAPTGDERFPSWPPPDRYPGSEEAKTLVPVETKELRRTEGTKDV